MGHFACLQRGSYVLLGPATTGQAWVSLHGPGGWSTGSQSSLCLQTCSAPGAPPPGPSFGQQLFCLAGATGLSACRMRSLASHLHSPHRASCAVEIGSVTLPLKPIKGG